MKKYLSFFRLRFAMGLQYRVAALSGLVTQFVWGGLLILGYRAFYQSQPEAFPMTFQATATYIWLQQAFIMMFPAWGYENEIFESIRSGTVAYELCRPISIYSMWFSRTAARRFSQALLRCFPVLIVASLLPVPYGIAPPAGAAELLLAIASLVLGTLVGVAFGMIAYFSAFYTISVEGTKALCASLMDLLQGAIIPIPFLPDGIRQVAELLPFASMMNAPLRIYSGDIAGAQVATTILLQAGWAVVLIAAGKLMERSAMKRTVLLGG